MTFFHILLTGRATLFVLHLEWSFFAHVSSWKTCLRSRNVTFLVLEMLLRKGFGRPLVAESCHRSFESGF